MADPVSEPVLSEPERRKLFLWRAMVRGSIAIVWIAIAVELPDLRPRRSLREQAAARALRSERNRGLESEFTPRGSLRLTATAPGS